VRRVGNICDEAGDPSASDLLADLFGFPDDRIGVGVHEHHSGAFGAEQLTDRGADARATAVITRPYPRDAGSCQFNSIEFTHDFSFRCC
jgi:hypothetical protein